MVQHSPRTAVSELNRGEVDDVEVDVVLAHELVELDVLGVEPPLFPFRSICRRDTRVSDRSVVLRSS